MIMIAARKEPGEARRGIGSGSENKFSVAGWADKVVILIGAVNWAQGNSSALPDPTMRALEMTAERRLEIERPLTRYARNLEPRFKVSHLKLRVT